MSNYRQIWEVYNKQKIPKGWHIHHIDGNHENNEPTNLACVSPEEHFNIHLRQGDILCINDKFIQGAGDAGKIGGKNGKGKPKYTSPANQILRTTRMKKTLLERYGKHPLLGTTKSNEFKEKISAATSGENNPMFGKHHSPLVREQIRSSLGDMSGQNNPMFGKHHSNETKEKIAKKAIGRLHKDEVKKAISQSLKHGKRKWYTNGIIELFISENVPDGFVRGRMLKGKPKGTKIK